LRIAVWTGDTRDTRPNAAYPDGRGINTLTGADPIAPYGGAAFHDNKVWIRRTSIR